MAQVIQHVPNKYRALSSNLSAIKKKKEEKEMQMVRRLLLEIVQIPFMVHSGKELVHVLRLLGG